MIQDTVAPTPMCFFRKGMMEKKCVYDGGVSKKGDISMKERNPAMTRICGSSIKEGESETRVFELTNHI